VGEQFQRHVVASLRAHRRCILARKQTYAEAQSLYDRLNLEGIAISVIITGNTESIPEAASRCPAGHVMETLPNAAPWGRYCDVCTDTCNDVDLRQCRACGYDLCRACTCILQFVQCRVILGKYEGQLVPYPPQAEGNAVAPPVPRALLEMFGAGAAGGLGAALASVAASGVSQEQLLNALAQMAAGAGIGHNAKPATKKSVVEQLEAQAQTIDKNPTEEMSSSCALCLNDYAHGDKVTQLDCKHWFHLGLHYEGPEKENISCEGITAWLKSNNDCKMFLFFVYTLF
jgi:hypothetical protein